MKRQTHFSPLKKTMLLCYSHFWNRSQKYFWLANYLAPGKSSFQEVKLNMKSYFPFIHWQPSVQQCFSPYRLMFSTFWGCFPQQWYVELTGGKQTYNLLALKTDQYKKKAYSSSKTHTHPPLPHTLSQNCNVTTLWNSTLLILIGYLPEFC